MIIAIDFDGTCVKHCFPEIGEDIGAVPVLKSLTDKGHRLILFTMRSDNGILPLITASEGIKETSGNFLTDAVEWFNKNEIPLFGINTNPEQARWTTSPKAYAELYIDDAALGIPLIEDPDCRPYVDWAKVEELLKIKGVL